VIIFYFLLLILPLTTHPLWTGAIAGVTPIKAFGLMIAIYAVGYFFMRKEYPRPLSTWQGRLFLFLNAIGAISLVIRVSNPAVVTNMLQIYISIDLLFFATVVLIDSQRRLRYVLLAMIASMSWASFYVLREWQVYHNVYPGLRPGGVSGDCNYFASSALITLPMAYYFWRASSRSWITILCFSSIGMSLMAMMLGASRGGFLGLLAGLLMIIWRSKAKIRNMVLISSTVGPVVFLVPSSPLQRLIHPEYADHLGADIRIMLWKAGWRMIQAHPLFGVGLGNFISMSGVYEDRSVFYGTATEKMQGLACNAFLELTAELGIIGLIVFTGILVATYLSLDRVRRRTADGKPNLLNIAANSLQVALVSFSVSLVFLSGQYLKPFWMLVFLSMCLPALEVQQRRERHRRELAKEQESVPQQETEFAFAPPPFLGVGA
jgi:O-antigen ligase